MIKMISITSGVLFISVVMALLTSIYQSATQTKLDCDRPQLMCSFAKCWRFCSAKPQPSPTTYNGILCAKRIERSHLNKQWEYSCPVDYGPSVITIENNLNHNNRVVPSSALEK